MALSQSSQFRGCSGVPSSLASPRQRHRSASRHITNCHRATFSVKANVRERNFGDGSLQEGDQVQIFSRSGGMWADGTIMSIVENGHVWVEYRVGDVWCGKALHISSEYLTADSTVVQEYDPQFCWLQCLGSGQKQLRAGEGLLGMEVEPSQSVDNYADVEDPCIRWKPTEKRLVAVETLTKATRKSYKMGYGQAAIRLTKDIDLDEDFGNKVELTVKSIDGRQLLRTGDVSLGAGAADDLSTLTVGLDAKISRELTDGEGALSFEFSVPLLRIALKEHDPPADSTPYVSQAILGCKAKGEISAYGYCHAQREVGIKAAASAELLPQAKVSAGFKQKSGKNGYNVKVESLGGPPIKMPRGDKTMQEVFTYLQDRWLKQARQMPELWKVLKVQVRNCKHSESPDPALGEEYVSQMQVLHQKLLNPEKCSPDDSDSIQSLMQLIHLGRSEAERVANRHLTMVIGSTGSGKSTLISYLLGCPMEHVKVKGRWVVQVKQRATVGRIAEIGHGKTSSTFIPSVYPVGALDLCDCAGYSDTRGMEIRIANAVMLRQLAHHAKGVNFVILLNYNSFYADRAGGRRQLIQTLISYFGSASGLKEYADAVMLGITHVQQKHTTVEDIRDDLCDPEGLDKEEAVVLEKIAHNIFVYDPLDNGNESWCNRAQLLRNIQKMRVIDRQHAACMFETALGADEEQWLCLLKEGLVQRIDHNMKTGDYATAAREMKHVLILVENINSAMVVRRFADLRESVISHIQSQIDVLTQAGYTGAQAYCEVESRMNSMRKDIIHFQFDAALHDAIERHWHAGFQYVQNWNDKEALEKQLQALASKSVAHSKSDEPEAPKVTRTAESTIISRSTRASHADHNQAGRAEHRWSGARNVMSEVVPSMASMRDESEQCVPVTSTDFSSPPLVDQRLRTSSSLCSIHSEASPSQSVFRGVRKALNFSEYFKSHATGCQLGVPKGLKPVRTLELFEHEATGILCCAPLNIFDTGQGTEALMIVYHYTNSKGFYSFILLDLKELYASLLTKHYPRKDTEFGDGLYTTSKSPEAFGSKQAVLINKYSDALDPEIQKQDIASYEGSADFCVPLVVQRSFALDVVKYGVPDLGIKPGFNRHGDKVRIGRDIWVIKITGEEDHATNVHEPLDVLLDRVDRHDLRNMPDVLTSLGVHARRGNSAAARALVDLLPYPSMAIQELAKDEVRKLVSDAITGDGFVRTPAWESVSKCLGAWRSHDVFLWAQLLEHPGWHVFDAIGALVKCAQPGDGQALKLLSERFNDEDPDVRSSAVEAVGKVAQPGDRQALKLISERFDDKDDAVRRRAVEAVGNVAQPGDGQALKLLRERLTDRSVLVRECAVQAVGQLAKPGDGQALKLL